MKSISLLPLACAALLGVGACNANGRTDVNANDGTIGTTGVADNAVSSGDRDFVQHLTYDGNAEVVLGRLAAERAASADVKRFAQTMIDDHSKAGDELKQIAGRYNIATPSGLDDKHTELQMKLQGLTGAAFDKAYMDAMVDGHGDVVDALESRVDERDRSATFTGQVEKDTNVKPEPADNQVEASLNSWAASTLPVIKGHLDRAKEIQDTLDHPARNSTTRK